MEVLALLTALTALMEQSGRVVEKIIDKIPAEVAAELWKVELEYRKMQLEDFKSLREFFQQFGHPPSSITVNVPSEILEEMRKFNHG